MEEAKKNLLTYADFEKLEDELHDLKVVKRNRSSRKDQRGKRAGRPFSRNAEYDAAKDEQRDIEAGIIEEIEEVQKR